MSTRSPIDLGSDPASRSMGVRRLASAVDGAVAFAQRVTPAQYDDHGRIGVASLGVLIDAALGSVAYVESADSPLEFVVSRIAVATTPWVEVARDVTATGSILSIDTTGSVVSAGCRIESDCGLFGTATCRSIGVQRPRDMPAATTDIGSDDPRIGLGLASTDTSPDGRTYVTVWRPTRSMTNGLGSVQGGMILASAAAVADRVALARDPDRDLWLLDISIDIMKSPTVATDLEFRFDSRVARHGRRLTVLTSELRDSTGKLYAQSAATFIAQEQ